MGGLCGRLNRSNKRPALFKGLGAVRHLLVQTNIQIQLCLITVFEP